MNNEDIYNAWKEKKRKAEIHKNFADEVMTQIYQYEQNKHKSLFGGHRLIALISARLPGKAAAVIAGLLIGFVRITFVVYAFLAC